jgi:hypothetical protein
MKMDFENELAELDGEEYRKLKGIIIKNKNELKGLKEKEKNGLLARWIKSIKEERERETEEPEKEIYPWKGVEEAEIEEEKEEKINEIKSQIFTDKKSKEEGAEEYAGDVSKEIKKSPVKAIIGAVLLLLILAACIFGTMFLLKDNGDVRFQEIKDMKVKEGQQLSIEFDTKNADAINVYGLPEGSRFNNTTLEWMPTFKQDGIYKINAVAYNNQSNSSQDFRINVINVNRAPDIESASPAKYTTVYAGKKIQFKVSAKDEDNDLLAYTWYFGLDRYTGNSRINRTFTVAGDKNIKVKVCDKEKCAVYGWKIKVLGYALKKAVAESKKSTYVIIEIKDNATKEDSSKDSTLTRYIIYEEDEEKTRLIVPETDNDADKYDISTYEIGGEEEESVVFIGEDKSSDNLDSYTIQ